MSIFGITWEQFASAMIYKPYTDSGSGMLCSDIITLCVPTHRLGPYATILMATGREIDTSLLW
ncbi:uncharacterized protein FFM5_04334 [Fusarium fujikuroi]|nr:uncharacterized protein FFM5_04334 [Fusarium fujikuroi]